MGSFYRMLKMNKSEALHIDWINIGYEKLPSFAHADNWANLSCFYKIVKTPTGNAPSISGLLS